MVGGVFVIAASDSFVTLIDIGKSEILPETSSADTVTLYSLSSPLSAGDSKSGGELKDNSASLEKLDELLAEVEGKLLGGALFETELDMLNNPLSIPESDQITGLSEKKVATTLWFSTADTLLEFSEEVITGLLSSTLFTVTVTAKSLVLPELSVALTVKLYTLFAPSSPGAS